MFHFRKWYREMSRNRLPPESSFPVPRHFILSLPFSTLVFYCKIMKTHDRGVVWTEWLSTMNETQFEVSLFRISIGSNGYTTTTVCFDVNHGLNVLRRFLTNPNDKRTGTPKDRDEVNRREVNECDGWVWFRNYRNPINMCNWPLVDCARWTPEIEKNRSVSRWPCKNRRHTNSSCKRPDVLGITVIKEIPVEGRLL